MAAVMLRDLQSCFSLVTGVARGKLESGLMVTEPVGWNKYQEKWLNLTMEFGKPFMFHAYVAEPSLLAFFQSHNDDFSSKTNSKALTRKHYIALMWRGRRGVHKGGRSSRWDSGREQRG
jgi:hypothetical protein